MSDKSYQDLMSVPGERMFDDAPFAVEAKDDIDELSDEAITSKANEILADDVLDRIDIVDDAAIEAMRLSLERSKENEEYDAVITDVFEKLTPDQKKAVLQSYHLSGLHPTDHMHPLWVNESAVPPHLYIHWFSPRSVKDLGWRGFRPVKRSPSTERWVPNARQVGSSSYVKHANMILGVIEKRKYLARLAREFQSSVTSDGDLIPAFAAARKELGLTREQAAKLDREFPEGMIRKSVPETELPEDEELEDEESSPSPRARKGARQAARRRAIGGSAGR